VVNYVDLQVLCLLLCRTLNKIKFSGHILVKTFNPSIQKLTKFLPAGAKIFHEDGQTDGHRYRQESVIKLIVNFRNFAKGKKCLMFQVGLVLDLLLPYGTALNLTNYTNTHTHTLAL
jgi:hypothetical protein